MPARPHRIFISYRRDPVSRQVAGHLVTRLEAHFFSRVAFLDARSTEGERFDHAIALAIADADLVVAIVGPKWFRQPTPGVDDWVVNELRCAVEHDVKIVVVGIDDENGTARRIRSEWLHDLLPDDRAVLADVAALDRETPIRIGHEFEHEGYTRVVEAASRRLPARARQSVRRRRTAIAAAAVAALAAMPVAADRFDRLCEARILSSFDPCELEELDEATGSPLVLPFRAVGDTTSSTARQRSQQAHRLLPTGGVLAATGYPRRGPDLDADALEAVLDDTRRDGIAAQLVVAGTVERAGSIDRVAPTVYVGDIYQAAELAGLRIDLDPFGVPTSGAAMSTEEPPPEFVAGMTPVTSFLLAVDAYERGEREAIDLFEDVLAARPPDDLRALVLHLLANAHSREGNVAEAIERYDDARSTAEAAGADELAERAAFGAIEAPMLPAIVAAQVEQPICEPSTVDALRQALARFQLLASGGETPTANEFTPFKATVGVARAHLALSGCDSSTAAEAEAAIDAAFALLPIELNVEALRDRWWNGGAAALPQHARGSVSVGLTTRARIDRTMALRDGTTDAALASVLTDFQAAASPDLTNDPKLQLDVLLELLEIERTDVGDTTWSDPQRTVAYANLALTTWAQLGVDRRCDEWLRTQLDRHLGLSCPAVDS